MFMDVVECCSLNNSHKMTVYKNDDAKKKERRPSTNKGRQLLCRKCEGHGIKAVLKGHTAICPFAQCKCSSCNRLIKMRRSAFIRRYRNVIGDKDPDEINLMSGKLFGNANTRYTITTSCKDDIENASDDYNPGSNLQFSTTPIQNYSIRENLHDHESSDSSSSSMTSTVGLAGTPNTAALITNPRPPQIVPFLNNIDLQTKGTPEMSAQRDLMALLQQAQRQQVLSTPMDAMSQQQLQQQFQTVMHNGNTSPPRPCINFAAAAAAAAAAAGNPQQQMVSRQKRPNQLESFTQNNEPSSKRPSLTGFPQAPQQQQHANMSQQSPSQNTTAMQLGSFANTQHFSNLNPYQQQQVLCQLRQQVFANQPAMNSLPPPPPVPQAPAAAKMPFPAGSNYMPPGYSAQINAPFPNDEPFQNYVRQLAATQNNTVLSGPPPQQQQQQQKPPQTSTADLSSLFASHRRYIEEKQKQNELEIRMQQARAAVAATSQSQQIYHLNVMQPDHRRRSLPGPAPPLGAPMMPPPMMMSPIMSAAPTMNTPSQPPQLQRATSATQVNQPTPTSSAEKLHPPSLLTNHTVSLPSPMSAHQNQPMSPSSVRSNLRYQVFLNCVDLLTRKVLTNEKLDAVEHLLNLPQDVVTAAKATHLAQIPLPAPSVTMDDLFPTWQQNLFQKLDDKDSDSAVVSIDSPKSVEIVTD